MRSRFIVGAAAALACACERGRAPAIVAPPPPEVAVVTVHPQAVPLEYEYVGRTEAYRTVEIRARVPGFLQERAFEEGGRVREGDVLFRIDPSLFQADVEIARARVQQADAALALAQLEVGRFEQAAAAGAGNVRELNQAQTTVVDARAAANLARAELAKAELNLSYTEVRSPVSGTIGRALKDVGSYLDAGENSLLAVAMQTDPMYVTFSFSERNWLEWSRQARSGEIRGAPNPPVRAVLLDGTVYPHEGRLDFVDVRVAPETGMASARANFPNPDDALKPGQFVRAIVHGWERPNSIVVPQRAVNSSPAGQQVLVVGEGDVVEPRPVRVGPWRGDGWLILEGLRGGERVVVDGAMKAPPGGVVRAVEEGG